MASRRPSRGGGANGHMVTLPRTSNGNCRSINCRVPDHVHSLVTLLYSLVFFSNFELNCTIIHTHYFIASGGGGRIPSLCM